MPLLRLANRFEAVARARGILYGRRMQFFRRPSLANRVTALEQKVAAMSQTQDTVVAETTALTADYGQLETVLNQLVTAQKTQNAALESEISNLKSAQPSVDLSGLQALQQKMVSDLAQAQTALSSTQGASETSGSAPSSTGASAPAAGNGASGASS